MKRNVSGKPEGTKPLIRSMFVAEDNINIDLKDEVCVLWCYVQGTKGKLRALWGMTLCFWDSGV